mmetsp:Transcript_1333/g.1799  ORF Transcript_1333/g.1799 Transcript_1333/m.1799 type:complete len:505 (-) Transcript_1333:40-1554(-)
MNNIMDIGEHARLSFEQLEAEGPAVRPLDFPSPRVRRGVRVNALVVHPTTGQRDILPGVIHRESYTTGGGGGHNMNMSQDHSQQQHKQQPPIGKHGEAKSSRESNKHVSNSSNSLSISSSKQIKSLEQSSSGSGTSGLKKRSAAAATATKSSTSSSTSTTPHLQPEEYIAYFPQRRLQDAIYGSVWACLVLKRHYGPAADDAAKAAGVRPGDVNAPIVWEIVGKHVAIKMIEWSKVHQSRGRLLEDPVKEIAAMQFIGTNHPNVLGSIEVLQDDLFLFSIMPYARGGDLFGYVVRDTELRGGEGGMSEPVARYWFKQLLEGLHFLQAKGICHRDLSLENILVDDDNCLIIDFGMCLRVPYSSRHKRSEVSDVTNGALRRLLRPQGTCGKHNYMSPEIFQNSDHFDGFAIDLWAAGVILYIMLTGFPPYDHATRADQRFEIIVEGQLVEQLRTWEIEVSDEAGGLMQAMLRLNPRDRLSLEQVMNHPWVTNPDVIAPSPASSSPH